jgi:hypothetical protein
MHLMAPEFSMRTSVRSRTIPDETGAETGSPIARRFASEFHCVYAACVSPHAESPIKCALLPIQVVRKQPTSWPFGPRLSSLFKRLCFRFDALRTDPRLVICKRSMSTTLIGGNPDCPSRCAAESRIQTNSTWRQPWICLLRRLDVGRREPGSSRDCPHGVR